MKVLNKAHQSCQRILAHARAGYKMGAGCRFVLSCVVLSGDFLVFHTQESSMDGNPDLLFTPDLPVVQTPAVCCVWKGDPYLRPWSLRQHLIFTGCYWLILLSGDVQGNPGPISFTCTVCRKAVTSRQNGVECTRCER